MVEGCFDQGRRTGEKARFSMENNDILGKVGIGFRKLVRCWLDVNLSYSYVYNPLWLGLVTVC